METSRPLIVACAVVALGAAACSSADGTEPAASSPAQPAQSAPSAAETSAPPATPSAAAIGVVASGMFERIGYRGEGTVELVEDDGVAQVRLSDFEVEQGPALRVYLSEAPAGSPEKRYDDDFVDLGKLREFSGDQTYDVPQNTDLAAAKSVVIWCAEFSVGFVVAPLDPV